MEWREVESVVRDASEPSQMRQERKKLWVQRTRAKTNNIWKARTCDHAVCVCKANSKAADVVAFKETFKAFWEELSSSFRYCADRKWENATWLSEESKTIRSVKKMHP